MSKFADVTNPVVIQASKVIQAHVDNYLRRMCIVSSNDSNMVAGEFKEVYPETQEAILKNPNQNSELKRALKGFFAYAGEKSVVVLEVAATPDTEISAQVSTLRQFIENEELRCFNILVPRGWYYPETSSKTPENTTMHVNTSLIALRPPVPSSETLPGGVDTPVSTASLILATNSAPDLLSWEFKDGETPVSEDVIVFDHANNQVKLLSVVDLKGSASKTFTLTIRGRKEAGVGDECTIEIPVIIGAWNANLALDAGQKTQQTTAKSAQTNNQPIPGYRDLSFSELVQSYVSLEQSVFFFITMKPDEDPSVSAGAALYQGKKSVFLVYDNLPENAAYPLDAVILGITANAKFDISANNPASPLNFKVVEGQGHKHLSINMRKALIDAPANFLESMVGNTVIMNGRCADGQAWEYYYQWYLLELEIKTKIQTLLINGVNNPNFVIYYNQNGLDILKANIISVLQLWQSRGVVTDFARTLNPNTNELEGKGDITMIDFYAYIAQNPTDYQNEVYKGFSFYVMIGRFPRQIFIDVTLN